MPRKKTTRVSEIYTSDPRHRISEESNLIFFNILKKEEEWIRAKI
jgi:hypothetical protein